MKSALPDLIAAQFLQHGLSVHAVGVNGDVLPYCRGESEQPRPQFYPGLPSLSQRYTPDSDPCLVVVESPSTGAVYESAERLRSIFDSDTTALLLTGNRAGLDALRNQIGEPRYCYLLDENGMYQLHDTSSDSTTNVKVPLRES